MTDYEQGWRDGVDECVKRIGYNLDTYHSSRPHIESTIRGVELLAIGAADSVGDYQAALAARQDRLAKQESES